MNRQWTRVEQRLPREHVPVVWIAPSGEEVSGGFRQGALWFLPGGDMYCYYTPTMWRYLNA